MDFPIYPHGHRITPRYTPLQVQQTVIALLKLTFGEVPDESDYPFKFRPNYDDTGILIDSSYNKEANVLGKPLIVVSRGGVSSQPVAIGDLVNRNMPLLKNKNLDRSKEIFERSQTTQVASTLEIRLLAKSSLEVDILSNEVFQFLVAMRTALAIHTPIQIAQGVSLSGISKFEQDDAMFICTASMNYTLQYKWLSNLTQHLIDCLAVHLRTDLTYTDPQEDDDRPNKKVRTIIEECTTDPSDDNNSSSS